MKTGTRITQTIRTTLFDNFNVQDASLEDRLLALEILEDYRDCSITFPANHTDVCLVHENTGDWPWHDYWVFVKGSVFSLELHRDDNDNDIFMISDGTAYIFKSKEFYSATKMIKEIFNLNIPDDSNKLTEIDACLHDGELYPYKQVVDILLNWLNSDAKNLDRVREVLKEENISIDLPQDN